jgi:carbonic anhydrase/acetyltransferase-like protein (isoleucine patch superfamily)
VIRGDAAAVRIGERSNVQDNCVIHVDEGMPCVIGAEVTLGHGAVAHGATIEDGAMIGMRATVLNGAFVGAGCIVAAQALVPEGKRFAAGQLIMGVPGKVARAVTEAEKVRVAEGVGHYQRYALEYRAALDQSGK